MIKCVLCVFIGMNVHELWSPSGGAHNSRVHVCIHKDKCARVMVNYICSVFYPKKKRCIALFG